MVASVHFKLSRTMYFQKRVKCQLQTVKLHTYFLVNNISVSPQFNCRINLLSYISKLGIYFNLPQIVHYT